MRFVHDASIGLFLAAIPLCSVGCTVLSPKLSTRFTTTSHQEESRYRIAQQAERTGQLAQARDVYSALQKSSPTNPEYAHRMAVVCTRLGDHKSAASYFEHARSLSPQNSALLADMGYSAFLQRDYPRAESLLRESIRLKPDDPRTVNNLAMAIGFQGRFEESLATFRTVNSDTQSLTNVAYIHAQRGELEAAREGYNQVLKLNPGHVEAERALTLVMDALPGAPQFNAAVDTRSIPPDADTTSSEFVTPISPSATTATTDATAEFAVVEQSTSGSQPTIAAITNTPPLSDDPANPTTNSEFVPPVPATPNSWVPTDGSRRESPHALPVVSAGSQFELPEQLSRPAELIVEPHQDDTPAAKTAPDELAGVFEDDENCPDAAMPEMDELVDLEWAKDDLARQAAKSPTDPASPHHDDNGLKGFCPVAIRDERRLAPALEEFSTEFQAQTYRFSSAEALARFQQHPEWYVPAAGGLDIIEVQRGEAVAQGSLDHAVWFRHRLHLFNSADNLAAFRAAPAKFVPAN